MKLIKLYEGSVRSMHNKPVSVAIFSDGNGFKVFQKVFFNKIGSPNWGRSAIYERMGSAAAVERALIESGHTPKEIEVVAGQKSADDLAAAVAA